MTSPDDIARAFDAFLDALVSGPWALHPDRAEAALEARRRDLRALAVQVDRAQWPPGVAALLWTPASHERPGHNGRADVVPIPWPVSDCLACE